MSEFVQVAIISMIGMWGGLLIMFGLWIFKQKIRHDYLIKRSKMSKAKKIPKTAVKDKDMLGNISKLIPFFSNLEPEVQSQLIERFLGGDLDLSEVGEGGELDDIISGLLEGIQNPKETQEKPIR